MESTGRNWARTSSDRSHYHSYATLPLRHSEFEGPTESSSPMVLLNLRRNVLRILITWKETLKKWDWVKWCTESNPLLLFDSAAFTSRTKTSIHIGVSSESGIEFGKSHSHHETQRVTIKFDLNASRADATLLGSEINFFAWQQVTNRCNRVFTLLWTEWT
jgi:hypothetical protein